MAEACLVPCDLIPSLVCYACINEVVPFAGADACFMWLRTASMTLQLWPLLMWALQLEQTRQQLQLPSSQPRPPSLASYSACMIESEPDPDSFLPLLQPHNASCLQHCAQALVMA